MGLVHLVLMVAPLSEPAAEVKEEAVETLDSLPTLERLFKFGKCVRSSLCTTLGFKLKQTVHDDACLVVAKEW